MDRRILQLWLVLLAWVFVAHATELRMSTAAVEQFAPVPMAGYDTLTVYGEQTHDLLDLIDLSLASGTIRFESLDLTNSSVISSTLSINAGTELVLDGVRTLNSNISISAAGGKVKVRNSMLGAINSPIAITHPASEVEIDNSAICRAQTGIRITAGQLTLNNTLFLTNTQALNIQGGQVLGLQNLSFQGCEKGIRIENSTTPLTFTRCDFIGARDSLLTNHSLQTVVLDTCYIPPAEANKVFGNFQPSRPASEPYRPQEKPLRATIAIEEDVDVVPVTMIVTPKTQNDLPYIPSGYRFWITLPQVASQDPIILTQSTPTLNWSSSQGVVLFHGAVLIGEWETE